MDFSSWDRLVDEASKPNRELTTVDDGVSWQDGPDTARINHPDLGAAISGSSDYTIKRPGARFRQPSVLRPATLTEVRFDILISMLDHTGIIDNLSAADATSLARLITELAGYNEPFDPLLEGCGASEDRLFEAFRAKIIEVVGETDPAGKLSDQTIDAVGAVLACNYYESLTVEAVASRYPTSPDSLLVQYAGSELKIERGWDYLSWAEKWFGVFIREKLFDAGEFDRLFKGFNLSKHVRNQVDREKAKGALRYEFPLARQAQVARDKYFILTDSKNSLVNQSGKPPELLLAQRVAQRAKIKK